jgi:hypothetical protein
MAVGLYEAAGELSRADAFRRRVYADSGMARIAEKVESTGLRDAEQASSALAIACNADIVALFGAGTCMRGMDTAVAAVRAEDDMSRRTDLAEAATAGMTTVINAPSLAEQVPEANERFRSALEVFIAEGVQSSDVYAAQAFQLIQPLRCAFRKLDHYYRSGGPWGYWMSTFEGPKRE